MSEEIEVSVGDDVVTDVPVDEVKPEEGKTEQAEEVAGDDPKNEDASTEGDKDQEQREPEKPEKNRFQKRIDEYAKKTHDALREAEYWKQKALSSEGTKQELAEHELEKSQARVEVLNAEVWQAKVEAAREKYADYDAVVAKSNSHVEPHVATSVLESDIGPELFHHFATNPDVLEKINGMTPKAAQKEILRLEILLESKDQKAPPVFKKTSTAPEPVKPVSSNRAVVQKEPHEMSFAEYESWRKKNGARW